MPGFETVLKGYEQALSLNSDFLCDVRRPLNPIQALHYRFHKLREVIGMAGSYQVAIHHYRGIVHDRSGVYQVVF